MPISALDKDTVKLITTTQIITSVSSAAKELIENAFDANANNIDVNLTDSGLSLIEVKDDGSGISKEDASYAGLPSYTSKISDFSDLESLETYGFRGEAISALCAVSDVTIITKTEQDDTATSYKLNHLGCIDNSDVCHRATGTTVQVRNIFKHIPVRRQIVANPRKLNQDVKHLETLIKCYGICKFFTRISYRVNNNVIFTKPVMSTMNDAVVYILGKKLTSNMSWIEVENTEINMRLMVPSKGSWDMTAILQTGIQYIFVNYRPIKHKDLEKVICKLILEGLKQESTTRKKPVFLLHILMDAKNIDFNLEPNKTEIFFKDQQIILDTIEKRLRTFYGIPSEQESENSSQETVCSQEYSLDTSITNTENERPACKRRKVQIDDKIIDEPVTDAFSSKPNVQQGKLNLGVNENTKQMRQSEIERVDERLREEQINANKCTVKNDEIKQSESSERIENEQNLDRNKFEGDVGHMINFPPPDLSDSDSNQSQNFVPQYNEINNSKSSETAVAPNNSDTPVFELSPMNTSECKTLSQLPNVDLGEDFSWEDIVNGCNKRDDEKENKVQVVNEQNKKHSLKNASLETWSKGQIAGLKGGTDVKSYVAEHKENSDTSSVQTGESYPDNSTGFTIFSRHMRSQFEKQHSTLTVPQIAYKITNMWKELTSEERGYYRDLACEEQREWESKKKSKKDKFLVDAEKNKKRLLSMLEKMRNLKVEKKENLVMRTTVAWDLSLDKIKERFLNNPLQKKMRLVIGSLSDNLWVVNISSHVWALDALYLRKQLNVPKADVTQENAESVELLLKQWLSEKDDLSLLHPLHSLQSNKTA